MSIIQHERPRRRRLSNNGEGAAFPLAQPHKLRQARRRHREDVTLLGLVAPNLERTHAGLRIGHLAQLEMAASARIVHQLG